MGKNDRMLTSPIGIDRIGQPGVTLPAIRVGLQPHGLAVYSDTNLIYVPNGDSNSTSVIDGKTNRIIDTIMIGNRNLADDFEFTSHVAVNPKTNKVYVSNIDADTVTVIDGKTNSNRWQELYTYVLKKFNHRFF